MRLFRRKKKVATTFPVRKCPYCDYEIPEFSGVDKRHLDELERSHMEAVHGDVVEQRRIAAGFRKVDGEWVDTLAQ